MKITNQEDGILVKLNDKDIADIKRGVEIWEMAELKNCHPVLKLVKQLLEATGDI